MSPDVQCALTSGSKRILKGTWYSPFAQALAFDCIVSQPVAYTGPVPVPTHADQSGTDTAPHACEHPDGPHHAVSSMQQITKFSEYMPQSMGPPRGRHLAQFGSNCGEVGLGCQWCLCSDRYCQDAESMGSHNASGLCFDACTEPYPILYEGSCYSWCGTSTCIPVV